MKTAEVQTIETQEDFRDVRFFSGVDFTEHYSSGRRIDPLHHPLLQNVGRAIDECLLLFELDREFPYDDPAMLEAQKIYDSGRRNKLSRLEGGLLTGDPKEHIGIGVDSFTPVSQITSGLSLDEIIQMIAYSRLDIELVKGRVNELPSFLAAARAITRRHYIDSARSDCIAVIQNADRLEISDLLLGNHKVVAREFRARLLKEVSKIASEIDEQKIGRLALGGNNPEKASRQKLLLTRIKSTIDEVIRGYKYRLFGGLEQLGASQLEQIKGLVRERWQLWADMYDQVVQDLSPNGELAETLAQFIEALDPEPTSLGAGLVDEMRREGLTDGQIKRRLISRFGVRDTPDGFVTKDPADLEIFKAAMTQLRRPTEFIGSYVTGSEKRASQNT